MVTKIVTMNIPFWRFRNRNSVSFSQFLPIPWGNYSHRYSHRLALFILVAGKFISTFWRHMPRYRVCVLMTRKGDGLGHHGKVSLWLPLGRRYNQVRYMLNTLQGSWLCTNCFSTWEGNRFSAPEQFPNIWRCLFSFFIGIQESESSFENRCLLYTEEEEEAAVVPSRSF